MRITIGELRRVIREVVEDMHQGLPGFEKDPAMVPKSQRWNASPLPPEGYVLETQNFPSGEIGLLSRDGGMVVTGFHTAKSTSGPLDRIKYDARAQKWVPMTGGRGTPYRGSMFGDSRSMKDIGVNPDDWRR